MTFTQSFYLALSYLNKLYIVFLVASVSVSSTLAYEMLSASSERLEGLGWFLNHSIEIFILAVFGIVGVHCFQFAGFNPKGGYRKWFHERACQKPWLFGVSRNLIKTFGALLVVIASIPLMTAMVFPIVVFQHRLEIIEWLQLTAMF